MSRVLILSINTVTSYTSFPNVSLYFNAIQVIILQLPAYRAHLLLLVRVGISTLPRS